MFQKPHAILIKSFSERVSVKDIRISGLTEKFSQTVMSASSSREGEGGGERTTDSV